MANKVFKSRGFCNKKWQNETLKYNKGKKQAESASGKKRDTDNAGKWRTNHCRRT